MSLIHEVLSDLEKKTSDHDKPSLMTLAELSNARQSHWYRFFKKAAVFSLGIVAVTGGFVFIAQKLWHPLNISVSVTKAEKTHPATPIAKVVKPIKAVVKPTVITKPATPTIATFAHQLEEKKQIAQEAQEKSSFSLTPISIKKTAKKSEQYPASVNIAVQLLEEKKYNQAEELLSTFLKVNPDNVVARSLLGRTYFSDKKLKLAIKTMMNNKPEIDSHPGYFSLLAAMFLKAENYQQAFEIYHILSKITPNDPKPWLGLSIALQALQQPDLASAARDQYIKVSQKSDHHQDMI